MVCGESLALRCISDRAFLQEYERRLDKVVEHDLKKKYQLGRKLGEGVTAAVFRIQERATGTFFALKKIPLKGSASLQRAVEREIKILKKIRHQHVTTLHDVYQSPNRIWAVLEFVSGGELTHYITMGDAEWDESHAARCAFQVLSAIAYLHSQGVVHRDIKLANLLRSSKSANFQMKVADFGAACMMEVPPDCVEADLSDTSEPSPSLQQFKAITVGKECVGTPCNMAPEVFDRKYGPMCDMWSFGCCLYELLMGEPPFDPYKLPADDPEYHLKRNVRAAKYPMDELDAWSQLSKEARFVVTHLLTASLGKRLSAWEALQHPWMKARFRSVDSAASSAIALPTKKIMSRRAQQTDAGGEMHRMTQALREGPSLAVPVAGLEGSLPVPDAKFVHSAPPIQLEIVRSDDEEEPAMLPADKAAADLSDRSPLSTSEVGRLVAELATNVRVRRLRVKLVAVDSKLLAGAIETNTTLTSLNLANDSVDEEGAAALALALTKNVTLRELHLGNYPLAESTRNAIEAELRLNQLKGEEKRALIALTPMLEGERAALKPSFYFVPAAAIRDGSLDRAGETTLPRMQELRDARGALVKLAVDLADAYRGGARDKLFISHRWEEALEPDRLGVQLAEVKKYLAANPNIEYVWYDYWCMPQKRTDGIDERTLAEKAEFGHMLGLIADLYLTSRVLILLDVTYMTRFWTQMEAWCAMKTATRDGLRAAQAEEARYEIVCIHSAPAHFSQELINRLLMKTPAEMSTLLRLPDTAVTNAKDKDTMLPVIDRTDDRVRRLLREVVGLTG